MEWKAKSKQFLNSLMIMEDEGPKKPAFCTTSTDWIRTKTLANGSVEGSHDFLGVTLKASRPRNEDRKASSIKFRIVNKSQYEPFLEENERRVHDIIQVYPKEFVFKPSAVLQVKLPSCATSGGQLVCLYSSNLSIKHGFKHLKWEPIDSYCFHVNDKRTAAEITCKTSGLYTIKTTCHPQVTKDLDQYTEGEVEIMEYPGIRMNFPSGCVARKTRVTLETICVDELYNLPAAAPISPQTPTVHLPPQSCSPEDLDSSNMVDVTSSPVVLVRPSKSRFARPIKLTLPLLGNDFNEFFERENSRIAVLQSKALDEERVTWKHHYSTPEIEISPDGLKVASFLITRGGLYKVVRRLGRQNMRHLEQISGCISRELCYTANNSFVTTRLRGLMTEIAEPGKQFVLRVALFDASQPGNPDKCFTSEVCSQALSLPLGKTRFLVRGSFAPDRDAADHTEERTVVFTGKTTFVDFYLKLRLSDPTKLPDLMGKLTLHGEGDVVFYASLHKPTKIEDSDEHSVKAREKNGRKKQKPLFKRQTVAEFRSLPQFTPSEPFTEDIEVSSLPDATLNTRHSLPALSESLPMPTPLSRSETGSPRYATGYSAESLQSSEVAQDWEP